MPLLYSPRFFAVNSAGVPYPNAKLYTYKAGTTNALSTYTSETFGTPLSNPVVADANGLFPSIHFDPSQGFDLHVVLKDQNNVVLWDEDQIPRSQTVFSGISTNQLIGTSLNVGAGSIIGGTIGLVTGAPDIELYETDAAVDNRRWHITADSTQLAIKTKTDAGSVGKNIIVVSRSGTAITGIDVGNSTDKPPINQYGKTTFSAPNVTNTSDQISVCATKPANTARVSTTTMTNDPDLVITTLSAGTFKVEVMVKIWGTTSGAQGIQFNVNFSQTFIFGRQIIIGYLNGSALGPISVPFAATLNASGGVLSQATISTTADDVIFTGYITTSFAGTFGFSWAQNSSSANATNVGGGSYMQVTRLA